MKTTLGAAALAILLLAGCASYQQGWKQQREVLAEWWPSVRRGFQNEPDPYLPSYEVGFHKELHTWRPLESALRGLRADIEYLLSRGPADR